MSTNYLKTSRQEIQNWELRGPSWLSQVSDFVLWPAQRAAEKLIPKGLADKAAAAIEKCLSGASALSSHTIDFHAIRRRVVTAAGPKHDVSSRLQAADNEARTLWNLHLAMVAGEGAAAGTAGLPGLLVDIPALFGLVFRLIHEIGTCYGYDVTKPEEREYILQILRTASAGELKTKLEALLMLKELEQVLISISWRKIGADLATKQLSKFSVSAVSKQLAKSLGLNLTKRKALQMVPIIGGLVGGSFNAMFAYEVGQAAYMSYRRRWIEEHGTRRATGADLKPERKPTRKATKPTTKPPVPKSRGAAARLLKKPLPVRRIPAKKS
jgi:hypothetical protein